MCNNDSLEALPIRVPSCAARMHSVLVDYLRTYLVHTKYLVDRLRTVGCVAEAQPPPDLLLGDLELLHLARCVLALTYADENLQSDCHRFLVSLWMSPTRNMKTGGW
jgi:hypothetical protein